MRSSFKLHDEVRQRKMRTIPPSTSAPSRNTAGVTGKE